MAKQPDLTDITAGFGSNTQHNANNDAVKTAFDNTLSRDGSTPNSMEADFDLNSNDLLNGGTLNADDIVVDGTSLMDQVDAAAASATAAASSASDASDSADNAAASFDSFDDIYLGEKASDPTTDNDGDALQEGALYWNSTDDELKVWNGSAWEAISGVSTFLDLTDTPSSYSGDGGKFVKIKAGEDGLEFAATTGSEPSDGDKGDITVSSSGTVWEIDDDVIGTAHLADEDWGDFAISSGTATIDNDAITTVKIIDDAVTRAKIADAAMSGDDSTLVTGTAGTAGNLAEWNSDGDLVDGPDVLDEDDMNSDSATAVATQQSIKAYVDSTSGGLTSGTAQASTSGTEIDFTSIPSTVSEIKICLFEVSTNGNDNFTMEIGDSGGFETSGYSSTVSDDGGNTNSTSSFILTQAFSVSTSVSGVITLINIDGDKWCLAGNLRTFAGTSSSSGSKELSATLDRIRITTTGGTNSFDDGTINILYQ